jgi:transposase
MRRGRQHYSLLYEKTMALHKSGLGTREISEKLGISYSACYHWIKGLRKPDAGNLKEFEDYVTKNGPVAAADIKERFPKHNEIFLTASRRGMQIKRHRLPRKYGEYAVWYFVKGQEDALKADLEELFIKYKELRQRIIGLLDI